MMGYRDPNAYDYAAEYWDEYIGEFGVAAYFEARYNLDDIPLVTKEEKHEALAIAINLQEVWL